MFTTDSHRKRKQGEDKILSSSMPTTSSWSDFIYSSPSSPSAVANNNHHEDHFNFDNLFDQNLEHSHPAALSGTNSRRHSVAVGEMDFHSFDFMKQDLNILQDNSQWDSFHHMLLNSNTATAPTDIHQQFPERPIHKRTMSLREDDPYYATLLSPTMSTTSSSFNFFSPSFLDTLVSDNNGKTDDATTIISDMSFMDSSAHTLLDQSNDFLKMASTVTPSAITNEINNMADWLLEQQQEAILQKEKAHPQEQKQKRQRRSVDSLHSPVSPTHTMGSSLSSLSPSPPITPMQPASLGFDPIPFTNSNQQQQQAQNGEWNLNQHLNNLINNAANNNNDANKNNNVLSRTIQGEKNDYLKPLIQDYLIRREHQERSLPVTGERTVLVLTSRVAQKSYGTEKRFLCPPPTTILKGANWWTNNSDSSAANDQKVFSTPMSAPKLTIHISGETINQTGVIEWQTPSGTIVDSTTPTSTMQNPLTGRCVSKQLYINDADEKRKRVEVLAKIQLSNGLQLGTFPSKGIKVISKPSKKRQSIKNMELCIHHGTTISLFNRIRSQTVSTKYLGVSNGSVPTNTKNNSQQQQQQNNGTCFVARTGSWDPFVIWIVDTTRSPDAANTSRPQQHHPNNPSFPPPPAIALQQISSANQPLAIHYNQPVVLQCVSTGLVSPVMIIRKVDKGSMVLGGHRAEDFSEKTGGECGDETLGDPVSQLHKIAFQIVQDPTFSHHSKSRFDANNSKPNNSTPITNYKIPASCHPVTYLACLNDVVGMHKTTYTRHLTASCQPQPIKTESSPANPNWAELMQGIEEQPTLMATEKPAVAVSATMKARRRMSSTSSETSKGRRGSLAAVTDRRNSTAAANDNNGLDGACWTEDVTDAAVWTIVGTDCASYTFWTPSDAPDQSCFNMPFNQQATTTLSNNSVPITPFPLVRDYTVKKQLLVLSGEHFSRDVNIWFGDIKASLTEFKGRDSISCIIPDTHELENSATAVVMDEVTANTGSIQKKIPLLLVRGDGVVYRTDQYYVF